MNYIRGFENYKELVDPIFVVGHPRSGTGLTVRALSLSPSTCYLGETQLFMRNYFSEASLWNGLRIARRLNLFTMPGPYFSGMKVKIKKIINSDSDLFKLVNWIFRHCKLEKNYDLRPSNPIADVMGIQLVDTDRQWISPFVKKYRKMIYQESESWMRVLLKDCSIISQRKVILEKTPLHVFCIPLIIRTFPQAKIIVTFRENIEEVLASYYFMTKKKQQLPYMHKVYKMSKKITDAFSLKRKDGYLSIRYEDWIENPSETWSAVYEFSGLSVPENSKRYIDGIKKTPSKFEKADNDIKEYIRKIIKK
jgi:hypothetical protein